MKRKKILFFHYDLQGGGAERVLVNLLRYLNRDKYDIALKTIFAAGPYVEAVPEDIKFSYVFKHEFRGFNKIMKLFPANFLHRIFVRGHYDIEVAYLENAPTRIIAACPHADTNKVAWVHTEVLDRRAPMAGFRNEHEMVEAYNKLNHVGFVSKRAKDCFQKTFQGVKGQEMHVIHNVNDFEQIYELANEAAPIEINSKELNLCFVGRLIHVKGLHRLVDAFSRLKDDGLSTGVNVYVLGTGDQEASLKESIVAKGLSDSIHMLGFDQNPYKYLSKMDLFLCTSYREGYSTAATEAVALGVPVFTTDCSGMDEILEGGKFGMIVPNDDDAIYEGLKDLLTHREKIDQYAAAIKAAPRMTTQRLVDKYEEFFDSL